MAQRKIILCIWLCVGVKTNKGEGFLYTLTQARPPTYTYTQRQAWLWPDQELYSCNPRQGPWNHDTDEGHFLKNWSPCPTLSLTSSLACQKGWQWTGKRTIGWVGGGCGREGIFLKCSPQYPTTAHNSVKSSFIHSLTQPVFLRHRLCATLHALTLSTHFKKLSEEVTHTNKLLGSFPGSTEEGCQHGGGGSQGRLSGGGGNWIEF